MMGLYLEPSANSLYHAGRYFFNRFSIPTFCFFVRMSSMMCLLRMLKQENREWDAAVTFSCSIKLKGEY